MKRNAPRVNNPARLTRLRDQAIKLRERVKRSARAFLERSQTRLTWWQRAFRVPMVADWAIFTKAKTLLSAFMALLGLAPGKKSSLVASMVEGPVPQASRLQPRSSDIRRSLRPEIRNTNRNRRQLYAEGLEQRQLLATDVSVSGNDLVIEDLTGSNNLLSVSRSGANLVLSDANEQFATGIPGAVLSNGNKTLTVPASSLGVAGKIIVKTQGGSDSLSVDVSTDLGFNVDYQGGSGTSDSLTLAADTVTSVTHTFTNANDGSISIVDGGTRVITYTGLEPITDNLIATDRIFTFNGGAETITLTDATGANMTIDSDLSESVTFANPTGSLTINAGTGNDIVTLTSVDAAFRGAVSINGDAGTDTVNWNAAAILGSASATGNVSVVADVITVTNTISADTGRMIAVSLMATGNVTLSGANADVTTGGGTFTVKADSDANGTGTFTSDDAGNAVSASGGAISIIAADVVLTGTLAGTSTLTIAPSTAGSTIGIGGGTGTFNLSDAELALLTDGFSSITIGDAAAGNIDINTATFTDSVVLNTSGRVNDATGADINVGAGNALTINGSVAPGQSPGILNVTGNLQLNAVSAVLLADDFNDNSIDPAKWNVVTAGIPQAGASVIETGGRIQLTGRGHLNTVAALNPNAPGGLIITGTWQFGSGDDRMQILTRSNGTPSGSFGDTGQGIELLIVSNTLSIVGRGSAGATVIGGVGVAIPQGVSVNDVLEFTLTDDGTTITGKITVVGNPSRTATVTATSNFVSATNLVTFHNRESGRVSFLDNVVIRSAFSGYNLEIGGTTPGESATSQDQINVTGTVTIGSGVRLNLSNFMSNYAPSGGDRIVIVNNDASDAIIGTFAMGSGGTDSNGGQLADGDTITNFLGSSRSFRLFYNGGDGNDVVLVENSTPAVVYVDDSFTANLGQTIADADLGTTGIQPAIFGVTAFTTINAALAAVTSSGTIIVNGGTYAETVSLTGTRTLEVTGPNSAQTVTIDDLTTIAGTPVVIEGSSILTVGDADSRTLAGVISGSGSFTKQGSGTYTLSGVNLYTGGTNINAGTLRIAAMPSAPVGAAGIYTFDSVSGATVNNAGSAGVGKNGALVAGSGVVVGGRIGNAMSTSGGSGARMEIAGAGISLTGGAWTGAAWFNNLFTDGDWNTLFVGAAVASSQLIIEAGTNRLGVYDNASGSFRPSGFNLVPAANSGWHHVAAVGSGTTTTFYLNGVSVGTADRKDSTNITSVGASPAGGGMQRFAQLIDEVYIYQSALTPAQIMTLYTSGAVTTANSIPDSSTVTIAGGAFLDLNGTSETIGSLAGAGTVTSGIAGSPTLTVGGGNGSGSFSGVIQNGAGTVSLAKTGTGTQTLSGSNLYTGATAVNNGTLVINGSVTSNVTVTTPGVLNGSGTVTGNVLGNGTFSPGNSPGVMTIVGNFTPSGTVNFEVNSAWTTAGTHFDQYLVTGLVNMAGSTVTFTNTADASGPAANSVIKLIDNNGTLDLTTAPTTPVDGAFVTIGSRSFKLFYNGGDGNDVTLQSQNTAPTAANSSVTTNEDFTYTFSATDFNFNDTDSGDVLSAVKITTIESAGDLEWFNGSSWVDVTQDQEISKADIDANRLRFIPDANVNGSPYAVFSFKVKDTGGPVLSVAAYTITINVSAINDVPVILTNTLSISEGATVVLGSSNINATDPDNTASQLTYAASSISGGRFEFAVNPGVTITSFTQAQINSGAVQFVHNGGEAAPSYSLVVSDGDLSSAASTVTIGTFTNINDAPSGANKTLTTNEDLQLTIVAADFGFSDVSEGHAFNRVQITTLPTAGTLKLNGVAISANDFATKAQLDLNQLTFDPVANASGSPYTGFTFQVEDDGGTANGGINLDPTPNTITINVLAINDLPVAQASSVTTNEDTPQTFAAGDFLFTDVEGDSLASITLSSLTLASGDTLKLSGTDVTVGQTILAGNILNLVYTPAANANGAARSTFGFTVNDAGSGTVAATFTIHVTAVNDASVILTNTLSISEGATVVLGSSNINATDLDNTASQLNFTASSITAGQFEFAANPGVAITSFTQSHINAGAVRFVHDGGEAAPSYSLVVSDGAASSIASSLTVGTFTNVNDAPVISTNKLSVRERTTVVLGTSNISTTDPDNTPSQLTYTASSISGGRFESAVNPGVAITSFTQDDINNSRVRFVDYGDEATPSYSLAVSDGAASSGPSIVELTGQSMTFVVTSTADSGAGSLRQAMIDSNVGLGYDTITFNISGAGVRTISPTTALPTITDAVVINGYTQPGSSANTLTTRNDAVILIELNGTSAGAGANGLTITSGGSLVTGLAINRFLGMGIHVRGGAAQNNTLQGNFVGLNASGTTAQANGTWGIFVDGSPNTTIGGATNGKRNLVSGNNQGGVGIVGSTATGATIEGNWIGTDITGSLDRGNALSGVYVGDAAGFGGVTSTGSPSQSVIRNNVISGNDNAGLWINSGANNTQVYGNLIGTNASGSEAIGNTYYGIHVQSNFNQIGGTTAAHRNVVSGTIQSNGGGYVTGTGIAIDDAGFMAVTGNVVRGNYIGTDVSGLMPIQNRAFGVWISSVGNSVDGNTIANSRLGGLRLEGNTGNNGTYINNTFSGNLGLAIDVGTVGRTLNDLPDIDGVLNYPVVTSTQIVGSELIVEGTMEAGKTVEIYISAPTADGMGQGRQRLASAIDNSLADENTASGQFMFRIPLGNGLSHGTPLTALTVGSTSEFSPILFAGEVGSFIAPQITLSATSVSVTSGNAIRIDGSFYDPDSVSWDGTVDYGDGSGVQPLTLNSDNTFRLEHTYVTAGSRTVIVKIRDNTLTSSTKTVAVIVQNVTPTASFNEFSLTTPASEGQTVTLTGQFEDTTGTHTATIDWGDGTTSEVTPTPTLHGQIVSLGGGKYEIQATHVYLDDSNSSNAATPSDVVRVVVTIEDETGASDSTPRSLLRQEIRNVRPSALNVGFSSTSITEGQSITLSSLSFVDPGVEDVHTLKVNWGDGDESLITLPLGTRSLAELTPTELANLTNLTHIYADDPSAGPDEYTITVEVADDDEPDSLNNLKAAQTISVLNAQPSNVTFSLSPGPFAESSAVTIAAGSFVDAGHDKHRVFIDWGDGTAIVTADLGAGVSDFSQIPFDKRTHVYRNDPAGTNSSYTISVKVADNDDREAFGSSSRFVSIANVKPVLSDVMLDKSGPIDEGDTVKVTGRFTDVGQLDRHRVNVNWGDGTSSSANISVIPPISPTANIIYAFTATHTFGGNFNPANIVVSVEDGRYVEAVSGPVFEPDGGVDHATLALVVRNVAPKAFIAPTLTSTRTATTLVAQVTDSGFMDTFTYVWSINGVPVTGDGDLAPERLLLDPRNFSSPPLIQVSITDDDGGTGSFDVQAIFGMDAPETLTINDPVTDSNGNTTISYTDIDTTLVTAPVIVQGSFVARSRNILVMGFGGDDTLDASRLTANFTAILNGGAQTDYLIGGAGEDFFFAHSGNDTVEGRAGADTYLLKPNSILTVIDAIGDNRLDFSPADFADSTGVTFDLSSINLGSLTPQTVSTSGSTQHIVSAMGSFSSLVGSQFGDTLTAASNSTVSGGAGNDRLKIANGVSGASLRGGADDDILSIDAGASISNINFGGDDGIDVLTNLGNITGLAFNGGADDDQLLNIGTILGTLNFGGDDGVDALFNTGSIANLTFNGGADDDIFVNNGSAATTLSFNGDDDVLLSGTGSIGTLNFGGDDGADIFANLGSITSLTFSGGADDDIFVNNGLDVMTLNFGGDDDVLLSGAGTIGSLNFGGDDGVDALLNTGNIGTLVFNGGADGDIFVNNGSVATNLSFNGDDDVLLAGAGTIGTLTFNGGADDDIFANLGNITSLTFNGGADDDIFVNNGNAVSTLSFGGDDDVLLAGAGTIGTLTFSGDDGVDALFNTGSITTLAFTGGADDDIFVNNGTVATTLSFNGDDDVLLTGAGSIGTLTFGGDDGSDIFANLGSITTLTFNGGADDDIFMNSGTAVSSLNFGGDDDVLLSGAGTIGTLNFGGDDGLDTLINLGSVTTLTFTGGADDDVLQNLGTVTGLTFGGGADDDLLLNTGSILGTLNFGGDDGVDILSNSGTITSLTFGGGADDDILQNAASAAIGLLNFGGDDGIDTLTNSGSVTTLTFAGGADGDRLIIKSGAVVGALVFAGGGTLANQNAVVADDGADLLANFGTITTLTFSGGADDDVLSNSGTIVTSLDFGGDDGADILANSGTIATLTFSGGADDDLLQNTGNVTTLTFDGGADDDVLQNTGNGIALLTFLGGADDDILINYGSNIASLVFNGGADDDILVSNGDSIGQLVFTGDDGIRVPGRTSNDTLIMRGTGSGASTSNILFSGGYGDDSFENNATGVANITFVGGLDDDSLLNNAPGLTVLDFQGDEGDDVLVNHGTAIGSLQFTGGADDDVFINDGQSIASLTFAGGADDDLLINIGELITTLTFNGGADDDVLVNRGSQITLLDFNGGADDDILINDASLIGTLSFTGDLGNDRLWNRKTGTLVSSIVFQGDDGIDTLVNDAAGIGTISFNGGADDDVLQNNAPIVTLTFSGGADDDVLINAGQVSSLAFNGGADDDILLNRGLNVETLTFTGDDGIDTLFNLGPVTSLTFNGGADDDVLQNTASVGALTFAGGADEDTLVNNGPVATLTFGGGADDDTLQNNATVVSLSFSGGADDDVLVNNGVGVTSLDFTGDDGADTLINNGSGISTIVFSGGADADSLRIEGRNVGNVTFYGGTGADSFTYNAVGRTTSSVRFDADAGNDFFALIGTAATVDFDGGLGDDGALIVGTATMTMTGGDGDDFYRFTSNLRSDITLTDTHAGLSDTSKDTLDFSSFTGGAINLDLRLVNEWQPLGTVQPLGTSQFRIKLTDGMSIENVVGTRFADTIYGNPRSNYLGGADFDEAFGGPAAALRGVTQWVLIDFDTYTNTGLVDSGEHAYTTAERDLIRQRVEANYRGPNTDAPWFDIRVVTNVNLVPENFRTANQYATIYINQTPASGRPGGLASEIDPGNVNLGGSAVVQVNGLLGGVITTTDAEEESGGDQDGFKGDVAPINDVEIGASKPAATSENFVRLTAKVAAHELAHLIGLRHQDSFGPIGSGIHNPPGSGNYKPIYTGPSGGVETFDHLIGSPASVGSTRFDDLNDLFFGEREAIKLAFASSNSAQTTISSLGGNNSLATATTLNPVTLAVPNTLSRGQNQQKNLYVQIASAIGQIGVNSTTNRSNSDWYSFTGRAGEVINIDVLSNSVARFGVNGVLTPDDYVDTIVRVYDASGHLIRYYDGLAENDDTFEPTDSSLIDLLLPAAGEYFIEVDTFNRFGAALGNPGNPLSPLNPANPNNILAYPEVKERFLDSVNDTDTGRYQLIMYKFRKASLFDMVDNLKGFGGSDTIVGGPGDSYALEYSLATTPTLREGEAFSRTVTVVDRGASNWTGSTVDYGDASGIQTLSVSDTGVFTLSHTWADNGTYTVTVRIVDDVGQTLTRQLTVVVDNVAPSATLVAPSIATYGNAVLVELTSPSDPSSADTMSGLRYAFATNLGSFTYVSYANASDSSALNLNALSAGVHSIYGRIYDKDNAFSEMSTTIVVQPRALAVTSDATTKVYGDSDPTLTFTYGTLVNNDTSSVFTGSLARTAGENVGSYAISQGTVSAGSNYAIVYAGANLSVTPRSLAVSADAKTKAYGASDPTLTYSLGALFNGDASSVLTGSLARIAGENVGSYAINQGTVSAGSNYAIVYAGANLSVTPRSLTVSPDAKTKAYGASDPTLTYSLGVLFNGDASSVLTGSLARTAGENVGSYAISQGTVSAGSNYAIVYAGANLSVTPRSLTVSAETKTKVYGDSDPTLTYSYGTLVNNDTSSVFTGSLVRTAGENVGDYAISQGTVLAGSNYAIVYAGANLSVTPRSLTVSADAKTKLYGASDPALTFTYGTLVNNDTSSVFTGSLARVAGENPGSYPINQGTLASNANYSIAFVGSTLTINAAPTVTIQTPIDGVFGVSTSFTFTATDADAGDQSGTFVYTIQWGDGTTETHSGPKLISVNHTYSAVSATGAFSITATARDARGATSVTAKADFAVLGWTLMAEDPLQPSSGAILVIVGSQGSDPIKVKTKDDDNYRVSIRDRDDDVRRRGTVYGDVKKILVFAHAGNDRVTIDDDVNFTVEVWAGAGDDEIKGGSGNDILMGESGNDNIWGGDGRDIVIGGIGADRLHGDANDDILIAGFTAFEMEFNQSAPTIYFPSTTRLTIDQQRLALESILTEWTSTRSYTDRRRNIRGEGIGARLNGTNYFKVDDNVAANNTVFDDTSVDTLWGDNGTDWFFANLDNASGVRDDIKDRSNSESQEDIDRWW